MEKGRMKKGKDFGGIYDQIKGRVWLKSMLVRQEAR
jgi:hypothetical protein